MQRAGTLCYSDNMSEQTAVRAADKTTEEAETSARARKVGAELPTADSLRAEIGRVASDEDFTERARWLLRRDRELIERLAQ